MTSPLAGRFAAFFLIAQFALMQATLAVLGGAINWPASLSDPAPVALPRLIAHEGAVTIGYGCYMLAAMSLVPATSALIEVLNISRGMSGLLIALAALSAMAKAIGIGRWLFVMPGLAHAYASAGADKATLGLIFEAINDYAGGVGEVVGVGLASGLWTLAIAWVLLTTPGMWARLIGALALCGGIALLVSMGPRLGIDLGRSLLTISNAIWQMGLLALGIWALFKPRAA